MTQEDIIEKLGTAIKEKEKFIEGQSIRPTDSFIIRLDGVAFKNHTSVLQKPFDQRFTQAMKSTTEFLMKKFQPALGFVQSDEISLLFNPIIQKDSRSIIGHLYNGRIFKLISILSGAASSFFMASSLFREPSFFDARLVQFDPLHDVLIWRAYDLRRNSINSIGQKLYGHEKIKNVSLGALSDCLKSEYGNLEEKFGNDNLFGTLFKRKTLLKEGFNPIKNTNEIAERVVFEGRSIDLLNSNCQNHLKNPFWE
jgi:hypothetical protein